MTMKEFQELSPSPHYHTIPSIQMYDTCNLMRTSEVVRFVQGRSKYLSLCTRSPSGCLHHNRENAGTCLVLTLHTYRRSWSCRFQVTPQESSRKNCCVSRCRDMFVWCVEDEIKSTAEVADAMAESRSRCRMGQMMLNAFMSGAILAEFLNVVTHYMVFPCFHRLVLADMHFSAPRNGNDAGAGLKLSTKLVPVAQSKVFLKEASKVSFGCKLVESLKWIGVARRWGMLPYRPTERDHQIECEFKCFRYRNTWGIYWPLLHVYIKTCLGLFIWWFCGFARAISKIPRTVSKIPRTIPS